MLRPLYVLVCAVLVSIELCSVQVMADTQVDIQKEDGQCGESLITVNPTIIIEGDQSNVVYADPDLLKDVRRFMGILVSDSFKQQQDLDAIRDDLGSLKFGFAILQNTNSELAAESSRQKQFLNRLKWHLKWKLDTIEGALHPCGGAGWVKVVDLDMGNPTHECPSGWRETQYSNKRTCGRQSGDTDTCDSAVFPVDRKYSKICGRIKAYQYGESVAFRAFNADRTTSIDGAYMCGVVLTYTCTEGHSREHIWTFANGLSEDTRTNDLQSCPCDVDASDDRPSVPDFVKDNYFCESQNDPLEIGSADSILYPDDILWDGENCLSSSNCCEFNRPPYFIRDLGETVSSSIEARICQRRSSSNADTAVEVVELYVQ